MRYRQVQTALLGAAIVVFAVASCSPTPTITPTEDVQPAVIEPHTPKPEPTPTPAEPSTATPLPSTPTPEPLLLTSTSFEMNGMIPSRHTRRGDDISPPLEWSDPPEGTISFALLVVSDPQPDGGGHWVQWILYNIPAEVRALPEGIIPDEDGFIPDGSRHFKNSWEELKYGGPNPPHVMTFSYYFRIYALDTMLDLEAVEEAALEAGTLPWIGASEAVFLQAVEGHILAMGELVGKYKEE
jgi:Raf kinase inhibitor-like YbhB/YbcL family protein